MGATLPTMASTSAQSSASVPAALSARTTSSGMQPLGVGNALLLIDAGQHDAVGQAQARDQIGFEHLAAQRVGARLQDCPQTRLGINGAECPQRLANRRRMMRKVFDDGDAADLGAHLQPPLDAFEGGQRRDDRLFAARPARRPARPRPSRSARCARRPCASPAQPTMRPRATPPSA